MKSVVFDVYRMIWGVHLDSKLVTIVKKISVSVTFVTRTAKMYLLIKSPYYNTIFIALIT